MAAKVGGLSAVSYGIGVQNRYSAFLEDEDAFGLSPMGGPGVTSHAGAHNKNSASVGVTKQPKASNGILLSGNKTLAGKTSVAKGASGGANKNATEQRGVGNQAEKQRGGGVDGGKRQRPHQQQYNNSSNSNGANTFVQAPNNNNKQAFSGSRPGNSNQENTANNRFVRTQSNQHHQSNVSHNNTNYNSPIKEHNNVDHSQAGGKFAQRNNAFATNNNNGNNHQRQATNRRPYYNDDRKMMTQHQQALDDGHPLSGSATATAQSIEEEKRRRQQKRALDLKHKDPEKREARRQQAYASTEQSNGASGEREAGDLDNNPGDANREAGQRNRRRISGSERNQDEQYAPRGGFPRGNGVGGRGGRGRRNELGLDGEVRDGQQGAVTRVLRDGVDRPKRGGRNNLAGGPGFRGNRVSRGDDQGGRFGCGRDSDRPKPIPNFSDKLDFPSLAS